MRNWRGSLAQAAATSTTASWRRPAASRTALAPGVRSLPKPRWPRENRPWSGAGPSAGAAWLGHPCR
eukprot:297654-Lingulodinium_polyedra.AAC.1